MIELSNAHQSKMFRFAITCFVSLFSIGLMATRGIRADVKLPSVLNSHMVLQRDMPIPVWGWAAAGEKVTITIGASSATATTDADGKWKVSLPAMQADGKTYSLKVVGNNTVTLEDILIGDVWVGSGQSNMEWQLRNTNGAAEAIDAAQYPEIRLFHVKKVQKKKLLECLIEDWFCHFTFQLYLYYVLFY